MSREQFEEGCRGCRPAVINLETGQAEPDNSPIMIAINRVYDYASYEEKESFHKFTCLNSRDPEVLRLAGGLIGRIKFAVACLK